MTSKPKKRPLTPAEIDFAKQISPGSLGWLSRETFHTFLSGQLTRNQFIGDEPLTILKPTADIEGLMKYDGASTLQSQGVDDLPKEARVLVEQK